MLGNSIVHNNEVRDQILSNREILILQMLSDGLSINKIGAGLGLSGRTIGIYVSSCVKKLDALSIPHAVKIATLEGYIN